VSAGYASIEGADVDVRWSLFDRFGAPTPWRGRGRYRRSAAGSGST